MHLVSQSVFLKTLGWSLFNSLWQMALLWLVYIAITGAGKRFSAGMKYVTAVVLLATGSAWFLISFCTGYLNNTGSVFPVSSASSGILDYSNLYVVFGGAKRFVSYALPYCSLAYLAILIALVARYSRYYLDARRLKFDGLHKANPAIRIFVDQIVQQLGIRKKVSVWLSSVADSPMTVGFFKSVILIPIATINHLTPQQVEAILLHELAHIKRNDYFLNLLVTVTGILFFFNPFARLLIRHIRKETENSCDDLVIQFRYDPHTYVSALLSLERTRHQQQLAMAAIGKSNQVLLERVRRITGHKNKFRYNGTKLVLFFLVILVTCLTGGWFQLRQPAARFVINNNKQAVGYIAPTEAQQVYYIHPMPEAKNKKQELPLASKKKNKAAGLNENDNEANAGMNNLTLVSNEEPDDANTDNDEAVTATVQIDADRDYSIVQSAPVAAPPVMKTPADKFPFVPSSSFNFKIISDTVKPGMRGSYAYSERMAEETMQKALKALDALNWDKISKELTVKSRKVNIDKLKNELRKSLTELDWQKINDDINSAPDEANEQRIRENIQLQTQALKNCKSKSAQEIKKIQQQLLREKGRLYQENMR